MIDLIELAGSGRYQGARLTSDHNVTDANWLSFDGSASDPNGFVKPLSNVRCENNERHNVLEMHPKWVGNGTIKGWLPWRRLPDKAVFKAKVGFLHGASRTDGVTFSVWEHHQHRGRHIWNRIAVLHKTYNRRLIEIQADLSHLSGQRVGIELRVDAGSSSGQDWAVWVDPEIVSRTFGPNGKVVTIKSASLKVLDRQETRRIEGKGDEPYVGGIYFRSIFGKRGSTKVTPLGSLQKLGKDLRKNATVTIPESAELSVSDSLVVWDENLHALGGLTVMGVFYIAMERDKRGRGVVRDKLQEYAERLSSALIDEVESNPLGALRIEEVFDEILELVFPGGSGGVGTRIKGALGEVIKWFGRYDDRVGDNQIVLIGASERILSSNSSYDPTTRIRPVADPSPRTFTLEFRGSGAVYEMVVEVEEGENGRLVR